jgi:hypothetical protein
VPKKPRGFFLRGGSLILREGLKIRFDMDRLSFADAHGVVY